MKKLLLCLFVFISVLMLSGCGSDKKKTDKAPSDAINSAIGVVKTGTSKYYLKENFGKFASQLDPEDVTIVSTNDISLDDLDKPVSKPAGNVYIYERNSETGMRDQIMQFDVDGETTTTKDLDIKSFNIIKGTVTIKGKKVELYKTPIEDVIDIFGEKNIKRESSYLYLFSLSDYEWDEYRVYYGNGVVNNISVKKSND